MAIEWVDVAPIREAFIRSGLSLQEVARELGYSRGGTKGQGRWDSTRVARRLGMKPEHWGDKRHMVEKLRYEDAVLFVRAIGADPVDCGV